MSADLFARTKIEPGALVQTLDLDAASGTSAGRGERERGGPGLRVHSAGAGLGGPARKPLEKVKDLLRWKEGREEIPRAGRHLRHAPRLPAHGVPATPSPRHTRAAIRHQTRCARLHHRLVRRHGPSGPPLGAWRGGHWLAASSWRLSHVPRPSPARGQSSRPAGSPRAGAPQHAVRRRPQCWSCEPARGGRQAACPRCGARASCGAPLPPSLLCSLASAACRSHAGPSYSRRPLSWRFGAPSPVPRSSGDLSRRLFLMILLAREAASAISRSLSRLPAQLDAALRAVRVAV